MGVSVVYGGFPGRYWLQIDCAGPTSVRLDEHHDPAPRRGDADLVLGRHQLSLPQAVEGEPPGDGLPCGASPARPRSGAWPPAPARSAWAAPRRPPPQWNGTAWTLAPVAGIERLGRSCATPTRCLALDPSLAYLKDLALGAALDGRGWHAVTLPASGPPARVSGLYDVLCTATMCLAVGYETRTGRPPLRLLTPKRRSRGGLRP